ncbi:MAG: flagellar biosynthesis protein FlgN [Treponema sp.]|nr:flagellar biosynthesis protein FlgN [Treponema sp.]
MVQLSQEEIDERVSILKRFKCLLEQQRGQFQEYLNVLEKQQDSISAENPETLLAHTELEQQVVKSLSNLQKVIIPMNKMYKSFASEAEKTEDAISIENIQKEVSDLQSKVLLQNEINRDLLREHIGNIKVQLENFKNPYRNLGSVYAPKQRVATLVEINV